MECHHIKNLANKLTMSLIVVNCEIMVQYNRKLQILIESRLSSRNH